jgi:hypothetical protein
MYTISRPLSNFDLKSGTKPVQHWDFIEPTLLGENESALLYRATGISMTTIEFEICLRA